jgi:hypothetical protein
MIRLQLKKPFIISVVLITSMCFGLSVHARTTISLNGDWQFAPVENLGNAPATEFHDQTVVVPGLWSSVEEMGYPAEWRTVQSAWLHRSVMIPDSLQGNKFYLMAGTVGGSATIVVNGQQVGQKKIVSSSWRLDISDYIQPGVEAVVDIGVGSKGVWSGLPGGVAIEAVPLIHVESIRVKPTGRRQEIEVTATVRNLDTRQRRVSVAGEVVDERTSELTAMATPILAGESSEITMTATWPDDHLWQPLKPRTYEISVELRAGNVLLDRKIESFGLIDVNRTDKRMLINGVPQSLASLEYPLPYKSLMMRLSTKYFRTAMRELKRLNINTIRLAWQVPDGLLNIADAAGMMVIRGLPDDADAIGEQITYDLAHPSVIGWMIPSNSEQFPELLSTVRTLETIRPVFRLTPNGSVSQILPDDVTGTNVGPGPLNDVTPVHLMEYGGDAVYQKMFDWFPGMMHALGRRLSLKIGVFRMAGDLHTGLPLGMFRWFEFADDASPGKPEPDIQPRKIINDYFSFFNPGYQKLLPPILPSAATAAVQQALEPVTILWHPVNPVLFAGSSVEADYTLFNATHLRKSFQLQVGNVRQTVSVEAGSKMHSSLVLEMPESDSPIQHKVSWSLTNDADTQEGALEFSVYPTNRKLPENATVLIAGKQANLQALLLNAGIALRSISNISEAPAGAVLIAGPESDKTLLESVTMLDWVKSGGRLLVSEVTEFPEWLTALLPGWKGKSNREAHRVFPLIAGAGPLGRLTESELANWGASGKVADLSLHLPLSGSFRPTAFSPNSHGLSNTPVLEIVCGEGRILLSTLNINHNWGQTPAAQVSMTTMISYLVGLKVEPVRYLGIGSPDNEIRSFIEQSSSVSQWMLPDFPSAILVMPGGVSSPNTIAELKAIIEQGGRLLCLPLNESAAEQLNNALGLSVEVNEFRSQHQQLELIELSGITNSMRADDLIWEWAGDKTIITERVFTGQDGQVMVQEPSATAAWPVEDMGGYFHTTSVRSFKLGAKTIRNPGAVVLRVPIGKGEVILSQIAIATEYEKSLRVYSILLTNLGLSVSDGK